MPLKSKTGLFSMEPLETRTPVSGMASGFCACACACACACHTGGYECGSACSCGCADDCPERKC